MVNKNYTTPGLLLTIIKIIVDNFWVILTKHALWRKLNTGFNILRDKENGEISNEHRFEQNSHRPCVPAPNGATL